MPGLSSEKLRKLYVDKNLTQREIAEQLDLSQSYISRKMKEFGINSRKANFWSEEEKELMEQNYQNSSKKEMMELIPDRSWNAIKLKAIDLGLAKTAEEHRQSEGVHDRLRKNAKEKIIEVDFSKTGKLAYILGVIEGDGFHDKKGTIGLEVKFEYFRDKFCSALEDVGLNPGKGCRRGKFTAWVRSKRLFNWYLEVKPEKREWLSGNSCAWEYIEGRYDSDGNLHPSGSPRICSYDKDAKEFLNNLFSDLNVESSIQQNNVWISKDSRDIFFENVTPVQPNRRPS